MSDLDTLNLFQLKKLINENNINYENIKGSGVRGKILKKDLIQILAEHKKKKPKKLKKRRQGEIFENKIQTPQKIQTPKRILGKSKKIDIPSIIIEKIVDMRTLNFLDINKLCNTSPIFSNICKDEFLKELIYYRNRDIRIKNNTEIYKIINKFYDNVEKIIDENYPQSLHFKKWINKKEFYLYLRKTIIKEFIRKVSKKILKTENFLKDVKNLKLIRIDINKYLIAHPFHSILTNKKDMECENGGDTRMIGVFNIITLNNKQIKYILPSAKNLQKYKKFDEKYMRKILSDLFLCNVF